MVEEGEEAVATGAAATRGVIRTSTNAYMLVYKQREDGAAKPVPNPPEHLAREVQKHNDAVQTAFAQYNERRKVEEKRIEDHKSNYEQTMKTIQVPRTSISGDR